MAPLCSAHLRSHLCVPGIVLGLGQFHGQDEISALMGPVFQPRLALSVCEQ